MEYMEYMVNPGFVGRMVSLGQSWVKFLYLKMFTYTLYVEQNFWSTIPIFEKKIDSAKHSD